MSRSKRGGVDMLDIVLQKPWINKSKISSCRTLLSKVSCKVCGKRSRILKQLDLPVRRGHNKQRTTQWQGRRKGRGGGGGGGHPAPLFFVQFKNLFEKSHWKRAPPPPLKYNIPSCVIMSLAISGEIEYKLLLLKGKKEKSRPTY